MRKCEIGCVPFRGDHAYALFPLQATWEKSLKNFGYHFKKAMLMFFSC